ncbi:hypothetical protein N0V95_004335 [Ascochyta clinopodiicola]|nr:hypothetical protein N0V95_004335 [Ascochyta clinopodiicola]
MAREPASIRKEQNRLPKPSISNARPKDPRALANWKGVEPQSAEEMEDWMQRERALILHRLRCCERKAFDEKKKAQKGRYESALRTEWAKWETEADIQDGEIYDSERSKEMLKDMRSISPGSYEARDELEKTAKYRDAQDLWEDFLHFQNSWTRLRTNEEEDKLIDSEPSSDIEIHKPKKRSGRNYLDPWQENLIRLYNKWGIGDRNKLPEGGIRPDQLHVYPDDIRHTAKSGRQSYLKTRFPISALRLNSDEIAKKRTEVEQTRKAKERSQEGTVNTNKYATVEKLPEGHQLYHAVTEHTNPWQYEGRRIHTSWESSTWGSAVANKELVLGERRKCHRPRYETITIPRTVFEQGLLYDKTTNRRQVEADGTWRRGQVTHMVFDRYYKLDENEQRILLPGPHYVYSKPHYTPTGTVAQVHKRSGEYTARREAHLKFALVKNKDDALSDTEEGQYEDDHMSMPDVSGDPVGTPDPPDESEDGESEDEGDDFARTYKEGSGLPYRPRRPIGGPEPGELGSEDPPDDGDGPPGGDLPPGSSGDEDSDGTNEDDSDDEDGPPKPDGGGKKNKKRTWGIRGEKFTDDVKGKCRWVESTSKFPDGFEFMQRDCVPALKPGAEKVFNNEGKRFTKVYPRGAPIPVERKAKYKDAKWKRGKDGVFRKKDLKWRPVLILRKFNKDDGKYVGASDPFKRFSELINGNLPENLVSDYNKAALQYINRNDHEVGHPNEQPRWTEEETQEIVRYLNDLIRQHGLIQFADQWDNTVHQALEVLNQYRTEKMKQAARGPESVRTKFRRSKRLKDKIEDVKKRKGELSGAELRPKDYFNVEDLGVKATKPKASESKATKSKAKKRTAAGKTKRKPKAKTEEESGSEDEDGEESAGEGDDDDEPEAESRPPTKKHK